MQSRKLDKSGWSEYEKKRAEKILSNCRTPEEIGRPSMNPPKGYKSWVEYWEEIMIDRGKYVRHN